LIAFYALKFPHARLGILMRFGFVFIPRWIQFPAWCAFLLWLLLQFWGAYEQIAGFSNVSSLAHLGGTAVGVVLWFFWRRIELETATVAAKPAG
jgi:membrane associated rhomboid family serine protease